MNRNQLRQLIDKRFSEALSIKDKKQQTQKRNKLAAVEIATEIYHSDISDAEAEERIKAIFLSVNPMKKNPLPIGFGARLKELIAEGLPAKEAMKEVWREVKKSRAQTGTYSGSREIFGRKRRKNPRLKRGTYLDLSKASKSDLDHALNVASILSSSGFEKRANQIRKMVKNRKGFIAIDSSSALDSPAYKKVNPKRNSSRKNPIAIYNPPGKQKLLYGRAYIPVIRGIKTNGKYKGERYEHKFSKNEVSIYGNPDGSLIVKSNNNLRLWNYDKDI